MTSYSIGLRSDAEWVSFGWGHTPEDGTFPVASVVDPGRRTRFATAGDAILRVKDYAGVPLRHAPNPDWDSELGGYTQLGSLRLVRFDDEKMTVVGDVREFLGAGVAS